MSRSEIVFPTGDRLERNHEDSNPSLRLHSPFEKPGWNARIPGDQIRAPFPGTPIEFEGHFWEIIRVEPSGEGVLYSLTPWNDRDLLRSPRRLGAAELQAIANQFAADSKPPPSILLLPLYGLLPASDQERNEGELGLPAPRATLVSALSLLAISLPASAAAVLLILDPLGFGARHAGLAWVKTTSPIWLFLFAESLVRLLFSLGLEQPMGSLPVVLGLGTPRAIHQHLKERGGLARRSERPTDPTRLFTARDRITSIDASEEGAPRLEIYSPLGKPDWILGRTPIRYQGVCYVPTERTLEGEGSHTRHRFVLELVQSESLAEAPVDYTQEDAGHRARAAVRQRRLAWFELFGYFWGFLSRSTQQRLEVVFAHDPIAYTRLNATLTLPLAALCAVAALAHLLAGTGGLLDLGVLIAMALLTIESGRRRRQVDQDVVTGSVVGFLIEPIAERLLRDLESERSATSTPPVDSPDRSR